MSTQEKQEHKCHWRAYGQPDGTVVCDECNTAADVNKLIDSAKREAYKQGYIDAGIKEITEGASKDLFQELLLYKAAYGELPLEQSEESK